MHLPTTRATKVGDRDDSEPLYPRTPTFTVSLILVIIMCRVCGYSHDEQYRGSPVGEAAHSHFV